MTIHSNLHTSPTPSISTVNSVMNCKISSTRCKMKRNLINYTIEHIYKDIPYKHSNVKIQQMTFGTTNRSKYGVRKIEAISSSNIIPVYCTTKNRLA
jgi:hypothetical protein